MCIKDKQHFTERIGAVTDPQPGLQPYENHRPMTVKLAFDGMSLMNYLLRYHPHKPKSYWQYSFDQQRIRINGKIANPECIVRAGTVVIHVTYNYIEPVVNTNIEYIYSDNHILVINKPAPLPVHASGRYKKNSLLFMLQQAFPRVTFKTIHRLDVNTTGVIVFGLSPQAATHLGQQFMHKQVIKTYVTKVFGNPPDDSFSSQDGISSIPGEEGLRNIHHNVKSAKTDFSVIRRGSDTSLLEAKPLTGRTNQIRIHLAALGYPIVGDVAYAQGYSSQTGFSDTHQLCLHAHTISFQHPVSGATCCFEAEPPQWFI